MSEQTFQLVGNDEAARAAMVELGEWAARLDEKIRGFLALRCVQAPPIIYRFSHPVHRALPSKRASVKTWETYPPDCSESGVWEVHIHPLETGARTILGAALAGLASVMAGPGAGFGSSYAKAAATLGLSPGSSSRKRGGTTWRNAILGPESSELQAILDSLGGFPLGALDASKCQRRSDRNLHKAVCPKCGPTTVRLSRKTFEHRILLCGGIRSAPHVPAMVTLAVRALAPEDAAEEAPVARRTAASLRLVEALEARRSTGDEAARARPYLGVVEKG